MCGISGVVSKNQMPNDLLIQKLNENIEHRGPDSTGIWLDKNVALAHRRLAILDLSPLGHQPMFWKEKYVIVFNGEVYNYKEIREILIKAKYTFQSETDTEVILAAYDFWGEKCVHQFNGMWSLAIYNKVNDTLFCSRDRFGIKPFYFLQTDEHFFFGSEIKQLVQFTENNILNEQIALDYLIAGIEEYNDETFFVGINKLLGGHNLLMDCKTMEFRIETFYSLQKSNTRSTQNFEISKQKYEESLRRSIQLRMRSDVKVGTCLSGGLDSSTIAALASSTDTHGDAFNAFHAKSAEQQTDESKYAQRVGEHCGLDLKMIEPSFENFKEDIEKIILLQEEPFGSPSIVMQYYVFKEARKNGCIVLLDGQGGDETLIGYERYYPALVKSLKGLSKIKALLKSSQNSKLSILQALKYQVYFTNYAHRLRHLKKRNSFFNKEVLHRYSSEILEKSAKSYNDFFELQAHEITVAQLPHLLKYEDRNSMAHSIESRLPFLDYQLVELALSLPHEHKIHGGWSKYVLRKIISPFLPNEIVWRKNKFGFNAPENLWISNYAEEMKKEINDSEILKKWIDFKDFNFESLNNRTKWRLYNFAKWEKLYNVQIEK